MITLRPYQKEVKQKIYNAWKSNYRNVLAVMPTGGGKCSAADTPNLMFNGLIKRSDEIKVGDKLMGPDSKPRVVKSISRGREEMFKLTPVKGDSYTFNRSHILTLRASFSCGKYK